MTLRAHPGSSWITLLSSLSGLLLLNCSVGEGEGEVSSEQLRVPNCWDGPYDLAPSFFSANPFRSTLTIRLQRGQQLEDVSDGVFITVNDLYQVREEQLGQQLPLSLPPGVTPPGVPLEFSTAPHQVSLALYLHDTCHVQNAALYAVDGWIQFDSLFSGNLNEDDAGKRLTEGSFEATVTDPREAEPMRDANGNVTLAYSPEATSILTGRFRFFFHRGSPAQAFP